MRDTMTFEHKVKYRTNKDSDTKFHTMTIKNYRKHTYGELAEIVSKKVKPKSLNYFDVTSVKQTR